MGYTHYFGLAKKPTGQQWEKIVRDVKQLVTKLPSKTETAGGYHSNDPLFLCPDETCIDMTEIRFNGADPDGKADLGHETFLIHPHLRDFNFCKTARKPYDLLVCAVLLVCHYHAPNVWDIGSDGDNDDWVPAVKFVESVLGDGYFIPPKLQE